MALAKQMMVALASQLRFISAEMFKKINKTQQNEYDSEPLHLSISYTTIWHF